MLLRRTKIAIAHNSFARSSGTRMTIVAVLQSHTMIPSMSRFMAEYDDASHQVNVRNRERTNARGKVELFFKSAFISLPTNATFVDGELAVPTLTPPLPTWPLEYPGAATAAEAAPPQRSLLWFAQRRVSTSHIYTHTHAV